MVLEVIENLPEVIWTKITFGVKKFIKGFREELLREEVTARIGASPYERSSERRG
jgi:transposase-like protein